MGLADIDTRRSLVEEIFNSITHGIGAVAGIVGLVIGSITLVTQTSFKVGFIIYAATLILLMTTSSLYHALIFSKARKVFQILDHSSIYILIAGSFTPFVIRLFDGWMRVAGLSLIWTLAAVGISLVAVFSNLSKRIGPLLYIGFGWLGVFLIPKLTHLQASILWLLMIGGVLYSFGVLLLISKRPFMHMAWHLFVVAAAVVHFFAIVKLA